MPWQDRSWAGFQWSAWRTLGDINRAQVPEGAGIYRIRSLEPSLLAYVGEGNLKGRVGGHWPRACHAPRHGASSFQSPRLEFLTRHREILGGYEVSWSQGPLDVHESRYRKAHERRVLWTYRRETRRSALANHSRAKQELDVVGGSGAYATWAQNLLHISSRPLESAGRPPWSNRWMGLKWTQLTCRRELRKGGFRDAKGFRLERMTKGPALYKALGPRLRLLKVGYKQSARLDVLKALGDLPEGTLVAWSNRGRGAPKHQCRELVSDLIGAHLERTGRVPDCQF